MIKFNVIEEEKISSLQTPVLVVDVDSIFKQIVADIEPRVEKEWLVSEALEALRIKMADTVRLSYWLDLKIVFMLSMNNLYSDVSFINFTDGKRAVYSKEDMIDFSSDKKYSLRTMLPNEMVIGDLSKIEEALSEDIPSDVFGKAKIMLSQVLIYGPSALLSSSINDYYSDRFTNDWQKRQPIDANLKQLVMNYNACKEVDVAYLLSPIAREMKNMLENLLKGSYTEYIYHILNMQAAGIEHAVAVCDRIYRLDCRRPVRRSKGSYRRSKFYISSDMILKSMYFECVEISNFYNKSDSLFDVPKCCLIADALLLSRIGSGYIRF